MSSAAATPADLGLDEKAAKARAADPPATHLRAKLDKQVRRLLRYEAGSRSGADPEDLHQMRVAIRRMRSVLALAGDLLGPTAQPVRAELGWLGGTLGEVRDYDVLIEQLERTIAGFDDRDQQAAGRLLAVFGAQRGRARGRLTRTLNSARYRKLLQSIGQLARQPEHEPDLGDGAGTVPAKRAPDDLVRALRKPHRKLRRAVAALPEDPPDDELHGLRKRSKRLRYAAELARGAVRKKQTDRLATLITAAKRLQTVLGDHQDAVVAAERMRAVLGSLDAETAFVAGRIVEREQQRRAQARADWPGPGRRGGPGRGQAALTGAVPVGAVPYRRRPC